MECYFGQKLRKFPWQTVEIFLQIVKILLQAVEILQRTVKIFMMNGQDFHDERSRFSWWTVEIFLMTGSELLMASGEIPERGGASRHPVLMGNLVDEFFSLFLV